MKFQQRRLINEIQSPIAAKHSEQTDKKKRERGKKKKWNNARGITDIEKGKREREKYKRGGISAAN